MAVLYPVWSEVWQTDFLKMPLMNFDNRIRECYGMVVPTELMPEYLLNVHAVAFFFSITEFLPASFIDPGNFSAP